MSQQQLVSNHVPLKSMTLADLADELKRVAESSLRGWKSISMIILAFIVLATIYVIVTEKNFKAAARLMILQQDQQPLNIGGAESVARDGVDDYIPTHSQLMSSPAVVQAAINSIGLENLPCLAKAEDTLDEAIARLTISRPERTAKILKIEFVALTGNEAQRMVAAIIESYKRFLAESSSRNNGQVATLITNARVELEAEIKRLEKDYLKLRQMNPLPDLSSGGKDAARPLSATRLEHWDRVLRETELKIVQLRAQLAVGRKLAKAGAGLWGVAHSMGQLSTDGSGAGSNLISQVAGTSQIAAFDYVRQLTQEQQQLIERYGPEYVKVKQIQEQIMRYQERSNGSKSRLDQGDVQQLLTSTEESLRAAEDIKADVVKRFGQDLEAAKMADLGNLSEANVRGELDRNRALFDTIVNQLKQAQFSGDYSAIAAQVVEPAKASLRPVKPRKLLAFIVAIVFGTGAGVGLVVVRDYLDPRIRSDEELRIVAGLPILGKVPGVPKKLLASQPTMGLISQILPQSPWAEAYRMIRTNLDFYRRTQSIQVILVSSALEGEGKSTTASNLAISFAQAGRKVLLVDADLRKPSLRDVYKLPETAGLVGVLDGCGEAWDLSCSTNIENLDVLPAGGDTGSPAELLMSPRLTDFVAKSRSLYNIIIFDTPPLLSVADPSIIGSVVDGIIFVGQATTVRRHEVERALEAMHQVGTPILGIIMNQSDPRTLPSYSGYTKSKSDVSTLPRPMTQLGLDPHSLTMNPTANPSNDGSE